jgi:RNA-dependent RNA polymerase
VPGGDLPFYIVAHDHDIQELMDAKHIPWGAQWNIARGVSTGQWKWEDVTPSKLDLLRGSNVEAAWKVSSVILGQTIPRVSLGDLEIW